VRLTGMPQRLRAEILGIIRNTEQRERQEHPLERLIDIEEGDDMLRVTTTGMHLARCIAGGLRRRFHDGLSIHYGESLVHVIWQGPGDD
jgi:hypothetical protein